MNLSKRWGRSPVGVWLIHIISSPPCKAAAGRVTGVLFDVLAKCLGTLWLAGDPVLAAVGQNVPCP